jgi:hypothetical protein
MANLEIVRRVGNWQEIVDYLNLAKDRSFAETAACARGRKQWWLNAEPNYSTKTYIPAWHDERLDVYLRTLMPDFALAQVFYANEVNGKPRGIDWHADAAYAGQFAYLLNLGNSRFEIKNTATGQAKALDMSGGELIKFNCKRPFLHRGIPMDSSRIGIGMWSASISIPNGLKSIN